MKEKKLPLSFIKKRYEKIKDSDSINRAMFQEDTKFSKLGEQWPSEVKKQREAEGRPCLTINKMSSFIRQVVNDARQNKPQPKVKAADSNADPETAEVVNGLIRNIEHVSNADVAYDTAIDYAVSGGWGYIRVGVDYAHDDVFEMDIEINRVLDPLSVYGDPNSTACDGSDWNEAFVTERIPKTEYNEKYGKAAEVDFESDTWNTDGDDWLTEEGVMIAEYWQRTEVSRTIVLLSDGRVFGEEELTENPDIQLLLEQGELSITSRRETKSHQVTQYIVSGADILEINEWAGRYIPIVPVYGEEFCIDGKRYFRSLINQAKDAQRMENYWRTTSTELVALSPRVPWIGRKGTFDSDMERWQTANTKSHAFLEYDTEAPSRQPLDSGIAAGAMQEALTAADDMKAIMGIYDASLGARSNETSGKAIMARQREGDVATFHFIDNLSRSIRQVGRILIDLIPHVYSGERVVRVLGEDGKEQNVPLQEQTPVLDKRGQQVTDDDGNPIEKIYDLTVGKYDLTVQAGPSFTSRREEAAMQITEMIRSYPDSAPILGGPLARNMDWPGADEIADKLEKLDPTAEGKIPPELQQQIQEGQKLIQQLQAENQELKMGQQSEMADAQLEAQKLELEREKLAFEREKFRSEQALQAATTLTGEPQPI